MKEKRHQKLQRLRGEIMYMKEEKIKPNYSALAKKYGYDRHTIAKYWNKEEISGKTTRGSYLDPYLDEIRQRVEEVTSTKKAMFRWFSKKYPEVFTSYSTFAHYTTDKGINFKQKDTTAHVRYETEPGVQLQTDWKEDIKFVLRTGEVIQFNIYSATFGYSRRHYFVFSIGKGTEAFIRCTLEVLKMAGGKPEEILTDNMSAIVNHQTGKLLPEINQFAKDLGVKIKRCKVRSPETKGKDESANRFIQWLIPYQNQLNSLEELLNEIKEIETDCNSVPNQTTGIPPSVLFKKEMEYLKPLPNKVLLDSYIQDIETQRVPQTLLIRYDGAEYSVPKKYIGKLVRIVPESNYLYIYHDSTLISVHELRNAGTINYRPEDYMEGLRSSMKKESEEDDIRKMAEANLKRLDKIRGE